jgi:hypothetical protein
MKKNLLTIALMATLALVPKLTSQYSEKPSYLEIQKEQKKELVQVVQEIDLTESRKYLSNLNSEINDYKIMQDFVNQRINQADSNNYDENQMEFYKRKLKKYNNHMESLIQKRDSIEKFIRERD